MLTCLRELNLSFPFQLPFLTASPPEFYQILYVQLLYIYE